MPGTCDSSFRAPPARCVASSPCRTAADLAEVSDTMAREIEVERAIMHGYKGMTATDNNTPKELKAIRERVIVELEDIWEPLGSLEERKGSDDYSEQNE